MTIAQFQRKILSSHRKNRRSLPWRKTKNPYRILVSEIMLQQTQISRVLPKYKEFLKHFPTLRALARASNKKLLKAWEGLGYWRRALFLKAAAKKILKEHKGKFPLHPALLEKLPGIGPYTARAVVCFSAKNRQDIQAFLDTNIRRVYLHFFFPLRLRSGQAKVSDKEILEIAQKAVNALPKGIESREWHYALFDYGAAVLKDKSINRKSRHYHRQSPFEGSFRSFRTKAVRFLLKKPSGKVSHRALETFLKNELKKYRSNVQLKEVISSLLNDKLVKRSSRHYSL